MASQTQGIQQLLAAEKRAAEKVSDARKRECARRFAARTRQKNRRNSDADALAVTARCHTIPIATIPSRVSATRLEMYSRDASPLREAIARLSFSWNIQ